MPELIEIREPIDFFKQIIFFFRVHLTFGRDSILKVPT